MRCLGAVNVGAGLFQGFPIGSSVSKSAANDRAGVHSQVVSIIAALVTALVAIFFTQFFYWLPEATLGATTDLDVPSADMLAELNKELHNRNLRFMLTRVIAPVRLMLERAGVMKEIRLEDIFIEPTDAVLDYFISESDDSRLQELLHSGLVMLHDIVSARLPTAPPERQVSLAALAERLDQEIKHMEM